MIKISLLILIISLISACSSIPDVKLGYHLPKVSVKIEVIQTASCNSLNESILDNRIIPSTVYSSDVSSYEQFDLGKYSSSFANSDLTLSFFEDGRISGVNSNQAGQGLEITKAVVSLIDGAPLSASERQDEIKACKKLKSMLSGDNKILSIKYKGSVDFSNGPKVKLKRITFGDSEFNDLIPIYGDKVELQFSIVKNISGICEYNAGWKNKRFCGDKELSNDSLAIKLRQSAMANFICNAGPKGNKQKFSFSIPVPQEGYDYWLPIPKAPAFGANRFELSLTESGKVKKIKYGNDTGSSQLFTTLDEIREDNISKSLADQANEVKAEADLIAQQQRLIRCQTDPENCE